MPKYNIIACKITSSSHLKSKDLFMRFIEKSYSESIGWGFNSLSLNNSLITGILLKKTKRYFHEWNESTNSLEKKPYFIVREISFFLDIEKGGLIVDGGCTNMNAVKQAFRQILWNEFTYSQLGRCPFDYFITLKEDNISAEIHEVTLADYESDLFVGRYIAKLRKNNIVIEDLAQYAKTINKIKSVVELGGNEVQLTISTNDTYALSGNDTSYIIFIEYILSNIIQNG